MVSVVIPTYNRAYIIRKSIDSVIGQTYKDFELIIVDDGSDDNTEEIIKGYKDPRIKYIKNNTDKHGPAAARNIGIKESSGEFIAFNDSDDEWHSEKLESQLSYMKQTGADIVFCAMRKIKGDREEIIPPKTFTQAKCTLENDLTANFAGTPAMFGKAECFKETLFDEKMNCNEDWDMMIRLLAQYRVCYQNKQLVEVTDSESSVSSDGCKAINAMQYIMDKHFKLYDKNPRIKSRMRKGIAYQNVLYREYLNDKSIAECKTLKNMLLKISLRVERYMYAFGFVAVEIRK